MTTSTRPVTYRGQVYELLWYGGTRFGTKAKLQSPRTGRVLWVAIGDIELPPHQGPAASVSEALKRLAATRLDAAGAMKASDLRLEASYHSTGMTEEQAQRIVEQINCVIADNER